MDELSPFDGQTLVGLTLEDAQRRAKAAGRWVQALPAPVTALTLDFVIGRVRAEVTADNIVTRVFGG